MKFTDLDIEHKRHLLLNFALQGELREILVNKAPAGKHEIAKKYFESICAFCSKTIWELPDAEVEKKVELVEGLLREANLRGVSIDLEFE